VSAAGSDQHGRRPSALAAALVAVLAFVLEHWSIVVFVAIVLLVAFVFAPRHMDTAIIVAACVGAGVLVGHWWVQ
jgi:apolipoprotein N-acyltransferase